MLLRLTFLLLLLFSAAGQAAPPAPFDLPGPTLDVVITRGKMILPASEVPNLAEGDRIWIRPEFPSSQSAHYLLVAAFLSGSTNPPPESWFHPCKTWTGDCAREGLSVTVPQGAQQALIFLAPETSGDLKGIVGAVRGRPGAFVRATQDLNQATLDRSRLERYLLAVHALDQGDPLVLKQVAPLLARSLSIKVDEKCLDKIPQLQAACLTQNQDSLILNDGHSMSIAETLTSGVAADLVMAVSATPELGYGVYSPYIASVLDLVRIFDSFRNATYQYIPALTSHKGGKLALTLNTPPSFHDPKSVMVVALPAIDRPHPPPLHAVNPADIYCASRNDMVLPVEGAPLAFSTRYAHDITLTLKGKDGKTVRLPAWADAAQGGYVVNTASLRGVDLGDTVRGALQGYWGFDPYQGPGFTLRNARANAWALAQGDEDALIVGRPDTVHLRSDSASCVDAIMLRDPSGKELKADWKPLPSGGVEVQLPLQDAKPGEMTLLIRQSGLNDPHPIPLQVFASAARLDSFLLHAGDAQGVLKGNRLDQVASLSLGGVSFAPGALDTSGNTDNLILQAADAAAAAALQPASAAPARVTLKDGRVLNLSALIDAPRPRLSLIGKSVSVSGTGSQSAIQLSGQDQLPQDARLIFSVRTQAPAAFTRDALIEVATVDEAFSATLSLGNGIKLENSKVALATLDPVKAFGFSAFGPLKFRPRIGAIAGDWQPLISLVRLPQLKSLQCPAEATRACKLSGSDLFLLQAVSGSADFTQAVVVSDGFPGSSLPVPHPTDGTLFIKLRDDPTTINAVTLPEQVLVDAAASAEAAAPPRAAAVSETPAVAAPAAAGAP